MVMHGDLILRDYGPEFYAWVGRTSEKIVCVAAPRFERDPAVRAVMRELVRREGGDCSECGNCPMGKPD
ncbi:hypothetical protein SACT1_1496 [Streptomyces sp. ACT-1]|nr:hypothetical protein SACT1_1496 [Streptomyces sp. ACT-1]